MLINPKCQHLKIEEKIIEAAKEYIYVATRSNQKIIIKVQKSQEE